MALPTFVVIGAMKAGTTSLHGYLAAHPDAYMATPKELNFFVAGKNWERGTQWYEERFEPGAAARARGEASPDYTKADVFEGVPKRMADVVPHVRLVYLVRQPVERMRSMYLHEVAAGRETRAVEVALQDNEHYLNTSRYAWQLDQFLEHFPPEQILVIASEQLRDDRVTTLARVASFLGLEPMPLDDAIVAAERGRTTDKRVTHPVIRRLRSSRAGAAVAERTPLVLRRLGRTMARRSLAAEKAVLSPALQAELTARLASDVARLRAFAPGAVDAWNLRQ